MPIDVIMPNLGLTMEAGTVARWLVAPGERVEAGQPLFEVETDKVSVEVEALGSGVLNAVLVEAGRKVAVGTVLARIGDTDEGRLTKDEGRKTEDDAFVLRPPSFVPPTNSEQAPRPPTSRVFSSPRARRVARERGIDWQALAGSGPRGRVVERDVLAASNATQFESASHLMHLSAEVDMSGLLDAQRRLSRFVEDLTLTDWLVRIVGVALAEMGRVEQVELRRAEMRPIVIPKAHRQPLDCIASFRTADGNTTRPDETAKRLVVFDLSRHRLGALWPTLSPGQTAALAVGGLDSSRATTFALTCESPTWSTDACIRLLDRIVELSEDPVALLA